MSIFYYSKQRVLLAIFVSALSLTTIEALADSRLTFTPSAEESRLAKALQVIPSTVERYQGNISGF